MIAFLFACALDTTAPVATAPVATEVGATEVGADLGATVWTTRCALCHGAEGRGDGPAAVGLNPPPKDLSRPRLPEERRPPSRMEIIKVGRPGTAMIGFETQLSPDELAAVTLHVQALAHGGAAMACPDGGAPPATSGTQ